MATTIRNFKRLTKCEKTQGHDRIFLVEISIRFSIGTTDIEFPNPIPKWMRERRSPQCMECVPDHRDEPRELLDLGDILPESLSQRILSFISWLLLLLLPLYMIFNVS